MNVLVFAVFLAVMQTSPPVPRQAADQPTRSGQSVKGNPNNQHNATDVFPSLPSAAESNQREGQRQGNQNARETVIVREPAPVAHKDAWDKAYVIFTGLLVIVGALGVAYAVRTLRAIKRQADEMEKQRELIRGQVGVMGEQLAVMQESAKTERIGARAALRQMEIAAKPMKYRRPVSMRLPRAPTLPNVA